MLYSPEFVCRRPLADARNPKGSRTWEWDRRLSGGGEPLACEKSKVGLGQMVFCRTSVVTLFRGCAHEGYFHDDEEKNRIELARRIIPNVKQEMQKP